jgi:hypothetical protein
MNVAQVDVKHRRDARARAVDVEQAPLRGVRVNIAAKSRLHSRSCLEAHGFELLFEPGEDLRLIVRSRKAVGDVSLGGDSGAGDVLRRSARIDGRPIRKLRGRAGRSCSGDRPAAALVALDNLDVDFVPIRSFIAFHVDGARVGRILRHD